jgi:hypothetical protein
MARLDGLNARDLAMFAARAFDGETSTTVKRLRYALTYSVTAGEHTSAKHLTGEQLHLVHGCLVDVLEDRLGWSYDDGGVTFVADGFGVTVLWSQIEPAAVTS